MSNSTKMSTQVSRKVNTRRSTPYKRKSTSESGSKRTSGTYPTPSKPTKARKTSGGRSHSKRTTKNENAWLQNSFQNNSDSVWPQSTREESETETEPYASQHDSFNEEDDLFAEIDLPGENELAVLSNKNMNIIETGGTANNSIQVVKTADSVHLSATSRATKLKNEEQNISVLSKPMAKLESSHTPKRQTITERLKNSLRQNARNVTPQNVQRQRRMKMLEATKEAQRLQELGTEFDIGPFYGLPSKVQNLFESVRGIIKLYDWQDECLKLRAVHQGRNLIYSLPTSGGKTLVAEILILRELLCKKRDAILILPFVAIVQEKVKGLSQFAVDLDFLVEEYAGSKGTFPPKRRRARKSLFVCTIEKANSLVNCLIEEQRIDEIGLVVVDELHMLGEGGSRGATLEMTLTKLLHCSPSTQMIGMSATLSNIKDLQDFLSAEIYTNEFRPVVLTEYVKLEDNIYEVKPLALCPDDRLRHHRCVSFKYDREMLKWDPDTLMGLVQEVIPKHSCLVFCPTKKNCENVAELLCKLLPKDMRDHNIKGKKALLQALYEDGGGTICQTLQRSIPYGIAYHHSGLTTDERKLIEEAYSEGTLCLLCCTSTLAAGVNLPAKRVILRAPYVGAEFLSRSQYKQMVGRAGRAGIDSSGESILILQKKDKAKMLNLVTGPCDRCTSSLLYEHGKGMRSLLLTTIGLKVTPSNSSLLLFVKRTLCYAQVANLNVDIVDTSMKALTSLIELQLVKKHVGQSQDNAETGETTTVENDHSPLVVTDLGRAVYKGSVDIDRGQQLYSDLVQARESLCVANHLHLLYLVTPYDMVQTVRPNWMLYLNELSCFDASEMKVATLIGISESFIAKKVSGQVNRKKVDEFSVKRFYLSLVLYSLWKQQTIWQVSRKFDIPRGFVQQLMSSAAAFASCVARFCEELEEFWAYQDLLSKFVHRLSYCVSQELIPLMEIPGVKQGRARQLYSAGYKTLQLVSCADPDNLVREIQHMPRKIAKQIIAGAKLLLQERVESLLDEAAQIEEMPQDMPVGLEIEVDEHGSQKYLWSDSQISPELSPLGGLKVNHL